MVDAITNRQIFLITTNNDYSFAVKEAAIFVYLKIVREALRFFTTLND